MFCQTARVHCRAGQEIGTAPVAESTVTRVRALVTYGRGAISKRILEKVPKYIYEYDVGFSDGLSRLSDIDI